MKRFMGLLVGVLVIVILLVINIRAGSVKLPSAIEQAMGNLPIANNKVKKAEVIDESTIQYDLPDERLLPYIEGVTEDYKFIINGKEYVLKEKEGIFRKKVRNNLYRVTIVCDIYDIEKNKPVSFFLIEDSMTIDNKNNVYKLANPDAMWMRILNVANYMTYYMAYALETGEYPEFAQFLTYVDKASDYEESNTVDEYWYAEEFKPLRIKTTYDSNTKTFTIKL